jgi:hypothetical protein
MSAFAARAILSGLEATIATASRYGPALRDYRAVVCRFEDGLFAAVPSGRGLVEPAEAQAMIDDIFGALGRNAPRLCLVSGFADPRIGGFADFARRLVLIERSALHRYLVLHESAHFLMPQDLWHGPGFLHVLQFLYRNLIGVPDEAIRWFMRLHALPPVIEPLASVA